MEFVVDTGKRAAIVVGATGVAEIVQNVRTILTTPKGSVPLDREFGLTWTVLDRPLPEAKAAYTGEAVTQIQKYEPRVKILSVSFRADTSGAMQGRLYPVVRITIRSS